MFASGDSLAGGEGPARPLAAAKTRPLNQPAALPERHLVSGLQDMKGRELWAADMRPSQTGHTAEPHFFAAFRVSLRHRGQSENTHICFHHWQRGCDAQKSLEQSPLPDVEASLRSSRRVLTCSNIKRGLQTVAPREPGQGGTRRQAGEWPRAQAHPGDPAWTVGHSPNSLAAP